jgi:hypothetical protein
LVAVLKTFATWINWTFWYTSSSQHFVFCNCYKKTIWDIHVVGRRTNIQIEENTWMRNIQVLLWRFCFAHRFMTWCTFLDSSFASCCITL